ncbi:MAG: MBL fold metallo-hydrolase [Candidatus Eremiobacteraeota bacterium]|nr:MBL fold metallo-hydrolase [Candidatus Eremiobacteraeota bacterium]
MPELTFVGAAGTVTGSKHLVSINGKNFFIDCGLFQGPREVEALNDAPLPIPAPRLDAIVITHGHLDHVGYLPKIVHDGYRGPIYCTPPTAEVIEIVLEDAAHLQQHMHVRGFHNERSHGLAPFFTADDVAAALRQLKTTALESDFDVCGATLRYHYAGHIIGAAFVEMNYAKKRTIFSGDLGRYNSSLLDDPAPIPSADTVICEATYGNRIHPPETLDLLRSTLLDAIERGGPILIPTFAVERAQDLLVAIGRLQDAEPKIARLPVHLDSPMAIKVDGVFAHHPEAYKALPSADGVPFGCRNLTLDATGEQSKTIDSLQTPAIVIASSGMATGGRILHHLHRNICNPAATIIFPGYQVHGTLGSLIVDGVSPIRIYGDQLVVRAKIVHLSGFSAHADQRELLRWLEPLNSKGVRAYIVHAEPGGAAALAGLLNERGFAATAGARGTTVPL